MPFTAQTYRILIASPSDLPEERSAVCDAAHEWNAEHAAAEGIVLLPVMWETHSLPESGVRPQSAITRQLVNDSDILVGMFWTRIGTNTGVAESGTVEEIDEFVAAGRPAMLYFSRRPIDPAKIDVGQFTRLKAFKEATYERALTGAFASPDELRHTLLRDLMRQVRSLKARTLHEENSLTQTLAIANLIATHQREKEKIAEELSEARQQLASQTTALQQRIEALERSGMQFFVDDPNRPPFIDDDPLSPGQMVVRVGLRSNGAKSLRNVQVRIVSCISMNPNSPRINPDTEAILEIRGGTPLSGLRVDLGHEIFPQVLAVRKREPRQAPEVRVNYAVPHFTEMYRPLPIGEWEVTLCATGEDMVPERGHFTLRIADHPDPRECVSLRMK